MDLRLPVLVALLAMTPGVWAEPASSDADENLLRHRLNNLESQAVQRQGRAGTALDLLNRQDGRLAGQALNRLKTRDPRNTGIPLLERRFERSQRPLPTSPQR